jgi:hypothetical protein
MGVVAPSGTCAAALNAWNRGAQPDSSRLARGGQTSVCVCGSRCVRRLINGLIHLIT